MSDVRTIEVQVPGRAYEVTVGDGVLDRVGPAAAATGARRVALVTHPHLAARYPGAAAALAGAGLDVVELLMDEGEGAKSWGTVGAFLERCARAEMHRDDLVVGLGGGVVTDTAGFTAATFLRGVRWMSCPTTVLGAIDAAVGGKTGVNLDAGKNLAGAFWQPVAVVVDTSTFASLPPRQVRAGLAEAVKCGWIADAAILDEIAAWGVGADVAALASTPGALASVVTRGIAVKAAIVAADEREGGDRAFLNYGHTLGHALETSCGYRLNHGEAISVGMVFAAEVAARRGTLDASAVARHREVLEGLGLPVSAPRADLEAAVPLLRRDKKAADRLRFVLLDGPSRPVLVDDVDAATIDAALAAVST